MKLIAKVGLMAIGAGLGVAGAGVAMKMLGYNIMKTEENIEDMVAETAGAMMAETEEKMTEEEAIETIKEAMEDKKQEEIQQEETQEEATDEAK